MKGEWRKLVEAQLEARETNINSGMNSDNANLLLVRNLQEYIKLHNLRGGYKVKMNDILNDSVGV